MIISMLIIIIINVIIDGTSTVRDLHDRLIKVVDAERSKTKGADYLGRLTRELLEFPEYVIQSSRNLINRGLQFKLTAAAP